MSAEPRADQELRIVNQALEKGVKGARLNDNMIYGIDENGKFKPGVYVIDAGSKAAKLVFSFLKGEEEIFLVAEISESKIQKWYEKELKMLKKKFKKPSSETEESSFDGEKQLLDLERDHRLAVAAAYFEEVQKEDGSMVIRPTLAAWEKVEAEVSAYADFLGFNKGQRTCVKRAFGSAFTDAEGALKPEVKGLVEGALQAECSTANGYPEGIDVESAVAAQAVAEAGLSRAKVWYRTQLKEKGRQDFAKVLKARRAVVLHNGRLVSGFVPDSIRTMRGTSHELEARRPELSRQPTVSYAQCGPVNVVLWEQIQQLAAEAGPGALVIPQPGSGDPECVVVRANGSVMHRAWDKKSVKSLQSAYGETLEEPAEKGGYVAGVEPGNAGFNKHYATARHELAQSDTGFVDRPLDGRIRDEYLAFRDMVLRAGAAPEQQARVGNLGVLGGATKTATEIKEPVDSDLGAQRTAIAS